MGSSLCSVGLSRRFPSIEGCSLCRICRGRRSLGISIGTALGSW